MKKLDLVYKNILRALNGNSIEFEEFLEWYLGNATMSDLAEFTELKNKKNNN